MRQRSDRFTTPRARRAAIIVVATAMLACAVAASAIGATAGAKTGRATPAATARPAATVTTTVTATTSTANAAPVVPAGPAAGRLAIGVGDQQPDMFDDPRFLALGIRYARLSVDWDALTNGYQANQIAIWLRAAHRDGVQPLISFDHSYLPKRFHDLPTPAQFAAAFRKLRKRFPWVVDFATWNEANYCGEPTCQKPAVVAAYYQALRAACPHCTILAAELLDEPNMVGWVDQFQRALGHQAPIWGLHNYINANRLEKGSTVALLKATTGQIWFTETGGVVSRYNDHYVTFPENPAHAAVVTSFVFDQLAHLSPRITRVYIYQWNAGTGHKQAWDSGIVGPEPTYTARPAFTDFVDALAAYGTGPPSGAVTSFVLNPGAAGVIGGLWGPRGPAAAPAGGPLAGLVTVFNARSGRVVATSQVIAGQRFAVELSPGTYILAGQTSPGLAGGPVSMCTPVLATVPRARRAVFNLTCPAAKTA